MRTPATAAAAAATAADHPRVGEPEGQSTADVTDDDAPGPPQDERTDSSPEYITSPSVTRDAKPHDAAGVTGRPRTLRFMKPWSLCDHDEVN